MTRTSIEIKDLQHRRDLLLMAYITGNIPKETARAECREITRAIEKLGEKESVK